MNSPLVSVIIPNFNRQKLVLETIESVLSQTYRPIEIIIVDDHSSDNSLGILKEYSRTFSHDNISLKLNLNPRTGAQAARNHGLEISKGEFIQFLDSDDLLLENKIQDEIEILKNDPSLHLVYSKCQFFDESGRKDQFWGRKLDGSSDDYFEFSWQTMCALYRKTSFEIIGKWNENLSINQDWEFSIRAILEDVNVQFLDKVNSLIREHDGESIGKSLANDLSKEKMIGKEKSLNLIFEGIKEKNLLDSNLEKKIGKRYLYILVQLGMIGAFDEQNRIIKQVSSIIPSPMKILLIIKSKILYKAIWKLYTKLS